MHGTGGSVQAPGAHVQAGEANWGFSMSLVLGGVGEEGMGESPRLACWSNVLLDWAWGTLEGPGSLVCGGVRSQACTHARSLGP